MYGERSAPFVSLNNSALKFVDGGAGVTSCAFPACISIEINRATAKLRHRSFMSLSVLQGNTNGQYAFTNATTRLHGRPVLGKPDREAFACLHGKNQFVRS